MLPVSLPSSHFPLLIESSRVIRLLAVGVIWLQITQSGSLTMDESLFAWRLLFFWRSKPFQRSGPSVLLFVNPLIDTLKPLSNGPLYSNTVIGTLAVHGWAITFGTARRGLGGLPPRSVPSSLYQMWQRSVYQLHIIRCGTVVTFALG